MAPSDPRSRIVLHMNWKGQALPVLLNGLPPKSRAPSSSPASTFYNMPQPTAEQIVSISPFAQIVRDAYRTPTFLIHGTDDDLIPYQQTQRVHDALVQRGVPAGAGLATIPAVSIPYRY